MGKTHNHKEELIGKIDSLELLMNTPKGHQERISGCGAYRNRKYDKKLHRKQGKEICKDYQ